MAGVLLTVGVIQEAGVQTHAILDRDPRMLDAPHHCVVEGRLCCFQVWVTHHAHLHVSQDWSESTLICFGWGQRKGGSEMACRIAQLSCTVLAMTPT